MRSVSLFGFSMSSDVGVALAVARGIAGVV
jgi:hypothetical protein